MKPIERWAAALAALVPNALLARLSGLRTLLPYHHTVSNDRLPHIANLYAYKSTRQFESDLDWLLRRCRPVPPDDFAQAVLQDRPLPRRSFLLSFDDGFRELHDVIAPILQRKGVPALFFLNPAFIDNKELFYRCKLSLLLEEAKKEAAAFHALSGALGLKRPSYAVLRAALLNIHYPQRSRANELAALIHLRFEDYLRAHQPFLTKAQVQSLHARGFVFGGHSMDHPAYRYLTLEEGLAQTLESVRWVQELAPGPNRFFAFPHEDAPVQQAFFDRLKMEEPLILFGLQNGKGEAHNRVWHRYNAEDPAWPLAGRTHLLLAFNAALRLTGRRMIERKI